MEPVNGIEPLTGCLQNSDPGSYLLISHAVQDYLVPSVQNHLYLESYMVITPVIVFVGKMSATLLS